MVEKKGDFGFMILEVLFRNFDEIILTMTQVIINEHTEQGQAILSLVKTFPKKIASIVEEEEDLSDCISLEEFGRKLKSEVKKRYEAKSK